MPGPVVRPAHARRRAPTWPPLGGGSTARFARELTVAAGPFSDRVEISRLRFAAERARPVVTGRTVNVTDVSDVIVFEVRADFYDRRGRHVGSGAQVLQNAEAFDREAEAIRLAIRPAGSAHGAVAAIVSIPQLVNE